MNYPADLTFEHQAKSSRLWALLTLLGIKYLIVIPHVLVLILLMIGAVISAIAGFVAVLFTAKFPLSLEKFIVNTYQYMWRLQSYFMCMTDQYPPFKFDAEYPANVTFEHQAKSSRLWAFLTLLGVKNIILIPQVFILIIRIFVSEILMFLGLFATLFMGLYPLSFERFIADTMRYGWKIKSYVMCMTDEYPPISWK